MSEEPNTTQVAVIGGGPGGYAAAFLAADQGMQVVLIDPEVNPGGVCLYRGCIPSKALLHVAKVLSESREATHWGIEFSEPKVKLEKLRAWKEGVVQRLTGGLGQLTKQRRVRYLRGEASFVDAGNLTIKKPDGSKEELGFQYALVATGSRPAALPGITLASPRILDSTTALEIQDIPKSMLVVGGGYIGLELGTVYATLGTQVSVVEMMPGLLPGADRDLVTPLAKRLEGMFRSIMLSTKVVEMQEQQDGVRVKFVGPELAAPEGVFEKVLVAVGRKPSSQV